MSYHHFTIDERESILIYRTQGLNFSQIAKLLHRHPSSISREWKRHLKEGSYSPSHAQESYHMAKSHCGRKRMLEIDHNLSNTVKHLFLNYQWSPEEIEGRLRIEEKLLLVIKQSIEPFTEVILMITHYLMVLVVSFVSSVIVEKHVIQKVMSKIEGKFLFLIRFTKDQKMLITELE